MMHNMHQLPTVPSRVVTKCCSFSVGRRASHRGSCQPQDAKRCVAQRATTEFQVREITDEDVQTLTDVQTDAFFEPAPLAMLNQFFKSLFRAEVLDSMRKKMRTVAEGQGKTAVIFVATTSNVSKPVAILELFIGDDGNILDAIEDGAGSRPDKYAWLASVAVDEQFRRQGCARVLLDAVQEKLHELECEWAVLSVSPKNSAAITLYESQGYSNYGMQGNALLDLLGSQSKVLMVRPRGDGRSRIESSL